MSSLDLPAGGSRASGMGTPLEDPILARVGSMDLSPSPFAWEGLKEDGPSPSTRGVSTSMPTGPIYFNLKRWSGSGRLESLRPSLASIEPFRAPSPLSTTVLVRAKVPDFTTARGRIDERYYLPSMMNLSPSSILDQIPPSKEFFGQGGVVEKEAKVFEGFDSVRA